MKTLKLSELSLDPESMSLLNIMTETGMFDSKGQIRRLFQQSAIKLNGERKENCEERLNELSPSEEIVIKAGRRCLCVFEALATILLRKERSCTFCLKVPPEPSPVKNLSAFFPAPRSEFNDIVSFCDDLGVVLDDHDGVVFFNQTVKQVNEFSVSVGWSPMVGSSRRKGWVF